VNLHRLEVALFGVAMLVSIGRKFKGLGSVSGTGMARFALVILCEENLCNWSLGLTRRGVELSE
jgi:hypothetical protein